MKFTPRKRKTKHRRLAHLPPRSRRKAPVLIALTTRQSAETWASENKMEKQKNKGSCFKDPDKTEERMIVITGEGNEPFAIDTPIGRRVIGCTSELQEGDAIGVAHSALVKKVENCFPPLATEPSSEEVRFLHTRRLSQEIKRKSQPVIWVGV